MKILQKWLLIIIYRKKQNKKAGAQRLPFQFHRPGHGPAAARAARRCYFCAQARLALRRLATAEYAAGRPAAA